MVKIATRVHHTVLIVWTISLILWSGYATILAFKNRQRNQLAHQKLQTLFYPPEISTSRPLDNKQAMELLQQSKELSAFISTEPAPDDLQKATTVLQKANRQALIALQQAPLGLVWDGHDANPGDFPYQVGIALSLYVPNAGRGYRCGGALITPSWVITAAHCFADTAQAQDVAVFAGQIYLSQTSNPDCNCWYQVKTLARFPNYQLIHSSYGDLPVGDVALLELSKEAGGLNVKPITTASLLPSDITPLATISGWGKKKPTDAYLADRLQYGTVRIVPDSKCTAAYGAAVFQQSMICTRPEPADICSGDSGGPLVIQDPSANTLPKPLQTVGIVSWKYPPGGCFKEMPGVFSRLTESSISQWISSCISGKGCPSSFVKE